MQTIIRIVCEGRCEFGLWHLPKALRFLFHASRALELIGVQILFAFGTDDRTCNQYSAAERLIAR